MFFLIVVNPSTGNDLMSLPDGISIKAVKAIRISESPDILKVVLTLSNKNKQSVRIENGRFRVIINPEDKPMKFLVLKDTISDLGGSDHILPDSKLELGETNPVNFEIKGSMFDSQCKCEKPGETSVQAVIPLSGSQGERKRTICKLINYLGLPGANKEIALIGNARVGIKEKDEWAYQNLKFELLCYKPKVQSESLFVGW